MKIKYLILFLVSTFFSCKKDIDYSYKIVNNTDFNLDEIEFDFSYKGQDGNIESLGPGKTSDLIVLNFHSSELCYPGFLEISVATYSRNDSIFTNTCGTQMNRSKFSEDNIVNYIEINLEMDPNPDPEVSCVFDIESR